MKIDLSGKKALIGGSSKGIGLGIASQLAKSGASVCLRKITLVPLLSISAKRFLSVYPGAGIKMHIKIKNLQTKVIKVLFYFNLAYLRDITVFL